MSAASLLLMGGPMWVCAIHPKNPFYEIAKNELEKMKYYHDGTIINGYYAIKSNVDDEIIWVDCVKNKLGIIINALNAGQK